MMTLYNVLWSNYRKKELSKVYIDWKDFRLDFCCLLHVLGWNEYSHVSPYFLVDFHCINCKAAYLFFLSLLIVASNLELRLTNLLSVVICLTSIKTIIWYCLLPSAQSGRVRTGTYPGPTASPTSPGCSAAWAGRTSAVWPSWAPFATVTPFVTGKECSYTFFVAQ